jgi:hypothetical protein
LSEDLGPSHSWRRGWLGTAILTLALASGCTQSALVGRNNEPPSDAAVDFDAPGFVDGRVHAHAVFDYVRSIYWLGGDNDRSHLVLYIYQDAVTCQELSTAGWPDRIRPTDFMGMIVGGNGPSPYPIAPVKPPAAGNAYVLHEIDQHLPVIDSIGQSGTVVITSVTAGETVKGSIDATFDTGTLSGQFNATWCPTGLGL